MAEKCGRSFLRCVRVVKRLLSGFRAWREPRALLILHVLITALLFPLVGGYRNEPPKIESDGKYYYQYLLSVWFDGDLDFANNYRVDAEPFMKREVDHYGFKDQLTPIGRPANIFTIGPAILWSPFFAGTHGVVSLLASAGVTSLAAPTGWELHFQYPVMFSALVYSALALVMLFDLLRRYFSEEAVAAGLLLIFWSSNWVYYCMFEPSMSHVYDLFTLVLFLWTSARAVRSDGWWLHAAAGAAGGLHVLVRTQNLVTVGIVIACLAVVTFRTRPRRRLRWASLAILIAALVLALVPLAASNLAVFGKAIVLPQGFAASVDAEPGDAKEGEGFLSLATPNLTGVLFSNRNGLFSHHPSLALAAIGLLWTVFRWRDRPDLMVRYVVPLGLAFVAHLWINASTADWWGGHAFGQRRFVSALPWFAVGFCALYQAVVERSAAWRKLVYGLMILLVAMNLYMTAIHVFMWSYDEPHDVLEWLFFRGPEWIRLQAGWLG